MYAPLRPEEGREKGGIMSLKEELMSPEARRDFLSDIAYDAQRDCELEEEWRD